MNNHASQPVYWVVTLYFMQGMPYALVMLVSAILLKQFNFTNSYIAFYTSLFILPWVVKFIFAGVFEHFATKKILTVVNEYGLALIAILIALLLYFQCIKTATFMFFLMALVASWHDITTDGLYLVTLSRKQQINFVGIRTLAFQLARLFCQGGLVVAVGFLLHYFPLNQAWMFGFVFLAILMLAIASYHAYVLPETERYRGVKSSMKIFSIFQQFFAKPNIIHLILFLFFYNVAEAQLIKIIPLFLLDPVSAGGLNMDVKQVGFIYGTLGMIAMLAGIALSSWLIQQFGLAKTLIGLTVIVLLSQVGYLVIGSNFALNKSWVIMIIVFAQFCYGLSNNAYMVSLLDMVREHQYSMSFYAIVTGIMAFGMMIPGTVSGYIQHYLGYFNFFIWIILLEGAVLCYTIYVVKYFNNEHSKS